MPRFGKVPFNGDYFSAVAHPQPNFKKCIGRVILGFLVRKQFGERVIFRVRRGTGYYNAIFGELYQDKYKYFVPSSINNPESEPYRIQWKAVVDYWQNILSDADKAKYNHRATKGIHMSGWNLFIKEAMLGEVHMFVNRGDPSVIDFDKDDLTKDGAWHDLDLSAFIPTTARAVLIELDIESAQADNEVLLRPDGNVYEINHTGAVTKVNNKDQHKCCIVAVGNSRIIEYKVDVATWTLINMSIRGWWT